VAEVAETRSPARVAQHNAEGSSYLSEGFAPKLVEQVGHLLETISQRGISILLVEQKLTIALKISHRVFVMAHVHTVFEGTPDDPRANEQVRRE